MPGADYELLNLLHHSPTANCLMLYQVGRYGGGTVLRLAEDIVENNVGARILTVCSEITAAGFRGCLRTTLRTLSGRRYSGMARRR